MTTPTRITQGIYIQVNNLHETSLNIDTVIVNIISKLYMNTLHRYNVMLLVI